MFISFSFTLMAFFCFLLQGGSKPAMSDNIQVSSQSQVHITQLFEENSNRRSVLSTQPNGLTPLSSSRSALQLPDRQSSATDSTHHGRQTITNKQGDAKPKPCPMSPDLAMKQYMSKLSSFEHHEVFNYPEGDPFGPGAPSGLVVSLERRLIWFVSVVSVYFIGQNAKKRNGVLGAANNGGYDDEQGSYIQVPHDQIAYRYEVLKVIGKGSFGQVRTRWLHV